MASDLSREVYTLGEINQVKTGVHGAGERALGEVGCHIWRSPCLGVGRLPDIGVQIVPDAVAESLHLRGGRLPSRPLMEIKERIGQREVLCRGLSPAQDLVGPGV